MQVDKVSQYRISYYTALFLKIGRICAPEAKIILKYAEAVAFELAQINDPEHFVHLPYLYGPVRSPRILNYLLITYLLTYSIQQGPS
jgi:hypothetical protein